MLYSLFITHCQFIFVICSDVPRNSEGEADDCTPFCNLGKTWCLMIKTIICSKNLWKGLLWVRLWLSVTKNMQFCLWDMQHVIFVSNPKEWFNSYSSFPWKSQVFVWRYRWLDVDCLVCLVLYNFILGSALTRAYLADQNEDTSVISWSMRFSLNFHQTFSWSL